MKLSNDQMDAIIIFLFYCVALGVVATIVTACEALFKFIIRRISLRTKRLSVRCLNTNLTR